MVRDLSLNEKFPLSRDVLIELIYLLFRWMFKNKWTDHKLVKAQSQTEEKDQTS